MNNHCHAINTKLRQIISVYPAEEQMTWLEEKELIYCLISSSFQHL